MTFPKVQPYNTKPPECTQAEAYLAKIEPIEHRIRILKFIKAHQPISYSKIDRTDLGLPYSEALPRGLVQLFQADMIKADATGISLTTNDQSYIDGVEHFHVYSLTEKGEKLLEITE